MDVVVIVIGHAVWLLCGRIDTPGIFLVGGKFGGGGVGEVTFEHLWILKDLDVFFSIIKPWASKQRTAKR